MLDTLHSLKLQPCPGFELDIPFPYATNYPVAYSLLHPAMPWGFDLKQGVVRADTCDRVTFGGDACDKCALLSKEDALTDLQERAWNPCLHETEIKDGYLTTEQMHKRTQMHKLNAKKGRRVLLGRERSLANLTRVLEQHKQIMVFIAQEQIARVHAVLSRALNSRMGLKATLELLKKAQAGVYHAKGYTALEIDEAILNLRLGGRRLCYALNHGSAGAPSESMVRAFATLPPYITCAIEIDVKIIKHNFEHFLFSQPLPDEGERAVYVLMMDDVKGSSRVRVSDHDGCLRGVCYHGLGLIDPKLVSYTQAKQVAQKMHDGEIHHGTEITNLALARNSEKGYSPVVVATSAGCSKGDPIQRTKRLLYFTLKIWHDDARGYSMRGPVTSLQPDGAAQFVKAGQGMFFAKKMDTSHPLHSELFQLKLYNTHVGVDPEYFRVAAGCEQKHVGKRARERAKSQTGMSIGAVNCQKITGALWRNMMDAAKDPLGISDTDIHKMFATGFADAQHVAPMISFFRTVTKMGNLPPEAFGDMSATFANLHKDVRLYARFALLLSTLLADKRPSLSDHLVNVSELSHLLFAIYRRHKTNFLPSQNYRNQQAMYRSLYWSVATAKVENIKEYFIFLDSGDALENIFNIVRCMHPGTAVDLLQFEERVGAAMQVSRVFAKHPHLAKEARHLATSSVHGPLDHNNPATFLSCAEGEGEGGQDRRRVSVGAVSILTCWSEGGARAASALTRDSLYSTSDVNWAAIANEPDTDMLRPRGSWVGVTAADDEVEMPAAPALTPQEVDDAEAAVVFEETVPVVPVGQLDAVRCLPCKITDMPSGPGPVAPSHALRVAMDGLSKKSESSRIARSQGGEKSGESVTFFKSEASADGEVILAGSCACIGVLLVTGFGVTPAIIMPESFTFQKSGSKMSGASISTEDFNVPGSMLTGHVMMLKPHGTKLQWRSGSYGPKVTLECVHAVALNPDVDILPRVEGQALGCIYTFAMSDVSDTANCLWSEVQLTKPNLVSLPAGGCLPYQGHIGGDSNLGTIIAFNLAGGAEALQPSATAEAAAAITRLVKCVVPGCTAEVPANEMRQHAAWHIKVQPTSVAALMMPCGLCGAHEQVQYSAIDALGCSVWLEHEDVKRRATLPRGHCKVVGELKYRQADAMKSTKQSPSSNHILACPACPVKPMKQYFWSYNMTKHWARAHKGVQMPPELLQEITLSDEEKTGLQKLKVPKLSKRKQGAREEQAAEKADNEKRARAREAMAAQPLGRGQRHGMQLAVDNQGNVCAAAAPAAAGDH